MKERLESGGRKKGRLERGGGKSYLGEVGRKGEGECEKIKGRKGKGKVVMGRQADQAGKDKDCNTNNKLQVSSAIYF